jgi:hypothetical protein
VDIYGIDNIYINIYSDVLAKVFISARGHGQIMPIYYKIDATASIAPRRRLEPNEAFMILVVSP